MSDSGDQRLSFFLLLAAGCGLPVLVYAAWDQALNFDPCNNIFKNAGTPCLESGWGGIAMGVFLAFVGGSIAHGAIRKGPQVFGNRLEAWLFCWLGLCMAAIGAAAFFAGFTMLA